VTEEPNRLLPALLVALIVLGSLVSIGNFYSQTSDSDVDIPPPSPESEPEPEPEPEPEIPCSVNQIEVHNEGDVECFIPISNFSYSPPEYIFIGEGRWLEHSFDGDDANYLDVNCNDPSILTPSNGSIYFFASDLGYLNCMVEVENEVSMAQTNFTIQFIEHPPINIDVSPGAWVLVKGQPTFIDAPSIEGNPGVWVIEPELPLGLTLNIMNGSISGVPFHLEATTVYILTVSNTGGYTNASITLAVIDQPPVGVHWGEQELILTLGQPMLPLSVSHIGGEPTSFEIEPPLPDGLSLNSSTGRIVGTPEELQQLTSHIIWSNNSGGGTISVLPITVNDAPVASIVYNHMPLDLVWMNDTIDMLPETTGGTAITWSIEPEPPQGLQFNSTTGRIFGSADTLHPWTDHVISTVNTGGNFSVILSIRIADHFPSNLSWGTSELILEANVSINFPVDNGGAPILTWALDPPIDGLSIDSSGTISGTPPGRSVNRHAWTTHTVWANNSGGSLGVNLTFAIHDLDADYDDLTVRPVGSANYGSSYPSLILPFGEWAFPVGLDSSDRPTVSASHAGQGRIVGYGHEAMVSKTTGAHGNLSLNALDWVCDGRQRVGLESSFNGWKDTLLSEGYSVITSATPSDLHTMDCFVTEFWNSYSDSENTQIENWLTNGGGLIMGGHAWYWSYSNSDGPHNYPGNKIAKTTGLLVSTQNIYTTTTVTDAHLGPQYRLYGALPLLQQHFAGTLMLTGDDADRVANTINLCASNLPLDFTAYWSAVRELSNSTGWFQIDSQNRYTLDADEIDDLLLNIQEQLMQKLPASELIAHPSSSSFPGPVNASAPRLNRTLQIEGDFAGLPSSFGYAGARSHGRMSTGLYAAPGEVVNITFPAWIVNQDVYVLVGAHTDNLWGKDTLDRHPRIHRWWSVDNTSMEVGNSFGGAIYVAVAAGSTLGDFNVTIENAVEMPWYQHGITNLSDWQNTLRHAPAPAAELSSDFFILTVPSSYIRNLDDPDHAMDFWDAALQMEHNLSGFTPWPRIERAVFDVQISAGWMHSGYPFMAHTASVAGVVNGTYMYENGDWGMFHELGHNHQWMSSTLPGNTETTCNLYSMYLMEDLVGLTGHGAMSSSNRQTRTETYFNNGAQISSWSVWTALETHIQIKEAFGWAPFTAAFQEYYYNYSSQPSGDSAEFNQWAIQISLNTGHNLLPYLNAWGFPLIQSSWDAVDHLPVWNSDPLRGWVYEYDAIFRDVNTANVTNNAADLEWEVYDNGTNTNLTVCWGLFDGGNSTMSWTNCINQGTSTVGEWQHSVSGLVSGQTYHWRVMGGNGNGQTWTDAQSFITT